MRIGTRDCHLGTAGCRTFPGRYGYDSSNDQIAVRVDGAALRLMLISVCLLIALSQAEAQAVPEKIVGIGAASCQEFVQESASDPKSERNYLAWMQGYMSGIVIGRPPKTNEGIDLNPKEFTLKAQLTFLRNYCLSAPSAPFAEAVEALFKSLRILSAT